MLANETETAVTQRLTSWGEPYRWKSYRAQALACAKRVAELRPDYDRDAYARGWTASINPDAQFPLDNADARGEPEEWYDGYHDVASGRDRWHTALGHPIE